MTDDSEYVPNTTETETDTDLELLEDDLQIASSSLTPSEFLRRTRSLSNDFNGGIESDSDCTEADTNTETETTSVPASIEFQEEDVATIFEDMYDEFDDYHRNNALKMSSPKYHTNMMEYITEIYYTEWVNAGICEEDEYNNIYEFVEKVYETYQIFSIVPRRSVACDDYQHLINGGGEAAGARSAPSLSPEKKDEVRKVLHVLNNTPQPAQRTKEWYEFRNSLITASNLWKVFGTDAQVNSIIYEKCSATAEGASNKFSSSDGTGSMQWGIKYERVTVMIYEAIYHTHLGEFGCIRHPEWPFIGASPDGINVDETSDRFGRMVEIKNIYNREINGIPKLEYWIQTQIQMETCNLNECDFVETRIKEYVDEDAFYMDNDHIYRGVVLSFSDRMHPGSKTHYQYMPLDTLKDKDIIDEWIEQMRIEMKGADLSLFSISYWYLDCFSCVLIERNRRWFDAALPVIKKTWDIIVKERQTGYEHRASQRAAAAAAATGGANRVIVTHDLSNSWTIKNMPTGNNICLVKLDTV